MVDVSFVLWLLRFRGRNYENKYSIGNNEWADRGAVQHGATCCCFFVAPEP
jgi:hypothetical protein